MDSKRSLNENSILSSKNPAQEPDKLLNATIKIQRFWRRYIVLIKTLDFSLFFNFLITKL